MTDQAIPRAAIVVAMPGDIDYGTADQAYGQLYAALTAGVPVVIADFTVTSYCDCTALRYLLAVQDRATASDAELRLAVPQTSPWTEDSPPGPQPACPSTARARRCTATRNRPRSA